MNFSDIGWAHYAPQTAPNPSCGRVALAHRDHFIVWTATGEVTATISGHLRHMESDLPCVGDWAILRDGSVISQVLPRRTQLSRKEPGKRMREQVLAANMDLLFSSAASIAITTRAVWSVISSSRMRAALAPSSC